MVEQEKKERLDKVIVLKESKWKIVPLDSVVEMLLKDESLTM